MDSIYSEKISLSEVMWKDVDMLDVHIQMARFDQLHPYISGNKPYKLKYFLAEAKAFGAKRVVTFGGPFSNHLMATASIGHFLKIPTKAIVRGADHSQLSPVMQRCRELDMEIMFVERDEFAEMKYRYGMHGEEYFIPEGGYHALGARGASLMWDALGTATPDYVVLPLGTATTLAGLLQKANCTVIAVPVLKNMHDIPERLHFLNNTSHYPNLIIWDEFHGGGYAKIKHELLEFMETFEATNHIQLDKIYTAKMMMGVKSKLQEGFFPSKSTVICFHTGGLTGNWEM